MQIILTRKAIQILNFCIGQVKNKQPIHASFVTTHQGNTFVYIFLILQTDYHSFLLTQPTNRNFGQCFYKTCHAIQEAGDDGNQDSQNLIWRRSSGWSTHN